ncbi:hypothetical protein AX774_g3267 [Zancudomyces culisetae]|uniref:Uncharacterized protein n=1 Tax=Zancudomyces culisetae TaxID=1213189 RepID=A0A1R1PQH2_ZANCU|nr:hypothetical protein AX774_g3267 [Zancudomyces culisetae]|eukprot:OMH83235.1 hypothetical protein AX774_g3267 [Zancudomyces culisetae]
MLDDTKVDRPYLSASETRGSVVKLSMDSLADASTKEGVSLNFGFEEYAGAEGLDFDNDAYSTTSNINLAGPSDSIELFGDEITKEIEKNDSWSKGFAEWLNTKKSNDIDTSDEDILKKKKVNGFGKLDENVLLPFDDELEAEHFGGKGGSCTDWSSRMDLDSSSKQNSNIKILSESGYSGFAQYHESIPIESIDLNANLIQKERIQKRLYGKQNSNKKGTELSVIQKLKNEYHYNEGLATDGRVYAGQQWGYEDADPNAVPFGKNAKSEYFKKMNRGKRARENTDNMDEEGNRVGVVESEQAYQKLMEARKKSKACIIVEDPEELGIDAEFLIAKNVEKMKKRNIYKRVYQVDLLKIQDGVSKVGTKTYFNIPESKDYVTAQASSGKKLYFTRFEANLPSIMGGVPGNRDSLNWTNPRINQIVLNIEQKMDREQLNR